MRFLFYFWKGESVGFLSEMTLDLKNPIDRKVVKTLMGHYGNWPDREKNLGKDYKEVQHKVNVVIEYLNLYH